MSHNKDETAIQCPLKFLLPGKSFLLCLFRTQMELIHKLPVILRWWKMVGKLQSINSLVRPNCEHALSADRKWNRTITLAPNGQVEVMGGRKQCRKAEWMANRANVPTEKIWAFPFSQRGDIRYVWLKTNYRGRPIKRLFGKPTKHCAIKQTWISMSYSINASFFKWLVSNRLQWGRQS